ncbi:hypothetical protein H0H93_007711 [Arthromyces matolae]|nr:hypothetical protein H0H93_007711 [Arthromyces matolae]
MLAQTGRLAIQRTLSFQGGSSVIRAPFITGVPFMVQQLRTARRKAPTDFYEKANRDDERLLKLQRLEAQLVNAKARSKRDEEAALAFQREQMNARKGPKGKAVVEGLGPSADII